MDDSFTCDICGYLQHGSSKRYRMEDGGVGIACRACWSTLAAYLTPARTPSQ